MVDNFEQIERLLTFEDENEFYMLQLLKRKKENPGMHGDSVPVKTVYIHRKGQLLELKDDLVFLANYTKSRVYINLNVKSAKKCLCGCLVEMAKRIAVNDFYKPQKIYDSVVGSLGSSRDPRWIWDVDWADVLPDGSDDDRKDYLVEMQELFSRIQPVGDKFVDVIPTKNGVHVITTAFNPNLAVKAYPKVSLHKNNPTLVYVAD